jgi:hypothetical protein
MIFNVLIIIPFVYNARGRKDLHHFRFLISRKVETLVPDSTNL